MTDPSDRPPPKPVTLEKGDTVILCEGFDDTAVVRELRGDWTKKLRIVTPVENESLKGELKLLATAGVKDGIASVGLFVDAENSRAAREREVKHWLRSAKLPIPDRALVLAHPTSGTVPITTAYLINPHGKEQGAIESLFIPQIEKSPRWPCIQSLLKCYRDHQGTNQRAEKVIVRTFIAHTNASNTGLNAAFKSNQKKKKDPILTCEGPEFDPIRRFIKLLRSASPVEQPDDPSKTA
jgi:hypothetical protein